VCWVVAGVGYDSSEKKGGDANEKSLMQLALPTTVGRQMLLQLARAAASSLMGQAALVSRSPRAGQAFSYYQTAEPCCLLHVLGARGTERSRGWNSLVCGRGGGGRVKWCKGARGGASWAGG
jgi:hypothetical protein